MALSSALRKCTAPSLFPKLLNPLRFASVSRSLNTNAQLTDFGPDDLGNVDVDRRSSDRGLSRRRDSPPSFFPLDAIDLFSPTRTVSQVLNLMDQMMDLPARGRRAWDVKEDDKAAYIRMDMPGVGKEGVKVWVEKETLMIKGEEGEENRRRFSTRLDMPADVYKLDEIKAEMKNGVLKVIVPKKIEDENTTVHEVQVQ